MIDGVTSWKYGVTSWKYGGLFSFSGGPKYYRSIHCRVPKGTFRSPEIKFIGSIAYGLLDLSG